MIIETSDNRFYSVREIADSDLSHLWWGIPAKQERNKRGRMVWKCQPVLSEVFVRKEASRVVEADA